MTDSSEAEARREWLKSHLGISELHAIDYDEAIRMFREAGYSEIGATAILHSMDARPIYREEVKDKIRRSSKNFKKIKTTLIIGLDEFPGEAL